MFNNKNIFIALTYKCNAFCKKCMTRYHINKEIEMTTEILNRIFMLLNSNSYSGWISVGTGEPLLFTDFEYFVKNILEVNNKIRLRLLTNGMLLEVDSPNIVFDERIKWGITMDAFNQTTLLDLQKGVDIEKVKYNISSVSKKYGGSHLYLNFTVTEDNIEEILPFCKFAIANNIHDIYLTELKIFSGYEKDLANHRVIYDEYLFGKLDEVKNYLNDNDVSTLGINVGKKSIHSHCYLKRTASPMIDVTGDVSFCSGREDIIIGNILDDNIQETWHKFVEKVQSKETKWCDYCYDKMNNDGIYFLPKTIRKEN